MESDQRRDDVPGKGGTSWPAEIVYRAWKMRTVRGLLAVVALSAIFSVGMLYGRHGGTDGHEHSGTAAAEDGKEQILYWTCSMHPQVKLPKPGQCPICFMDLIPVRAGEDEDRDAPRMQLSTRARELARVQTSPVRRKMLTQPLRLVGKIVPDETAITQISSYVPGRLDRLFVDYTGILVRKGDHLAEIYSPQLLVAQQEYLVALETADRNAAQPRGEAAGAAAGAMLEAARRKLELWGIPQDEIEALAKTRKPSDHLRIDAPLEGWVIDRKGYEGMYVETGTPIFTLADLRTVWVLLDAYELDVGSIRMGQRVEFETEAFPGRRFEGRVSYIDPVLDPDTRTVKVRVVVSNSDLQLKPEMFVRARVDVELGENGAVVDKGLAGKWVCPMHPEVVKDEPGRCDKCGMALEKAESLGYASTGEPIGPAIAVPRTAVLLTGRRAVVYVESENDGEPVYEGRVIELGPRAGDEYIVKAGLSEGERVVTHGALMIDSALQIQAKPSMMQPVAASEPAESPEREPAPPQASHYVADAMYHQHARPVVGGYLALAETLGNDDEAAAQAAVAGVRSALKQAVPHGLSGEAADLFKMQMAAVADSLPDKAKSIDELRTALPALTRAVESYLRSFGHGLDGPVYEAFCPMAFDNKGAAWLQTQTRILNPYFGKKMLRCGEIRGAIEPDGEWKKTE